MYSIFYYVRDIYAQKYKCKYMYRIPLEGHKKGVWKRSDKDKIFCLFVLNIDLL